MHLRLPCPFPPPLFSPSSRPAREQSREQSRESACRPLAPTSRPWSLAACLSAGGGWARAFPGPVENRLTPFDSPVCRLHPFKVLVFLSLRTSAFRQVWRLHLGSCTCGRPLGDLGGNDLCRLPAGGHSACLRGAPGQPGVQAPSRDPGISGRGFPSFGEAKGLQGLEDAAFRGVILPMLTTHIWNQEKEGSPFPRRPPWRKGGGPSGSSRSAGGGVVGARGPGGRFAQRAAGGPPTPLGQILLHRVPWWPLRPHSEAAPGCTEGPGWTPRSV